MRRDVERLRRLGYVIDASPGTDGGYRLRTGGVIPPLFLDGDESVAIVTALLAAAGDRTTGMVDASVRPLAKVHHVLPVTVQRRADAVRRAARGADVERAPAVKPGAIAMLAEACRDGEAVRFAYRSRDGLSSQRRVEPSSLVTVRSVWYLIAYDLDRADWRLFRVDRTDDVERTGHGTTPRTVPGGDPLAFLGASLAQMPYELTADIDVAVSREGVLRGLSWLNPKRVDATGDASCRIRLGAAAIEGLTSQIVSVVGLGAPTSITAPPSVLEHLAAIATTLQTAQAHSRERTHSLRIEEA